MDKLYFFVDSISDGIAILLLGPEGEQRLEVPASSLPAMAVEGDYLSVCFSIDIPRKESVREQIEKLMDELGDNP